MSTGRRQALSAFWHGAALASLFFFPLVQALEANIVYLLWQPRHTTEFAVAFGALVLIFGTGWYVLFRFVRAPRVQLAGLTLLCAIPLSSSAIAITRQLVGRDTPIPVVVPRIVLLTLAIAIVLAGAWLFVRMPGQSLKILRRVMLWLSPASLIVLVVLGWLTSYPGTPSSYPAPDAPGGGDSHAGKSSIYVFLFDELSYRFLYDHATVRPDLPNLRRFSERATNYHAAQAPGDETITSIPGLLAGRDFFDVDLTGDDTFEILPGGKRVPLDLRAPDSLFARAKANGFRTEMVGFYLPYCRLLADVADACQSFSWYNYSNVAGTFSPINPILTNLGLWPYQPPFGTLKVPVLSLLQRRIVERTSAAAAADLRTDHPRFRFVHFSVPHHPFVFDRDGYRPSNDPMLKNAENYERQLRYVDTLLGTLVDRLERADAFEGATVVVMADHEYRWSQLVQADRAHIPLMVKRSGQRTREDVTEPVKASIVLAQIVSGPR